jgi:hypothetical protein
MDLSKQPYASIFHDFLKRYTSEGGTESLAWIIVLSRLIGLNVNLSSSGGFWIEGLGLYTWVAFRGRHPEVGRYMVEYVRDADGSRVYTITGLPPINLVDRVFIERDTESFCFWHTATTELELHEAAGYGMQDWGINFMDMLIYNNGDDWNEPSTYLRDRPLVNPVGINALRELRFCQRPKWIEGKINRGKFQKAAWRISNTSTPQLLDHMWRVASRVHQVRAGYGECWLQHSNFTGDCYEVRDQYYGRVLIGCSSYSYFRDSRNQNDRALWTLLVMWALSRRGLGEMFIYSVDFLGIRYGITEAKWATKRELRFVNSIIHNVVYHGDTSVLMSIHQRTNANFVTEGGDIVSTVGFRNTRKYRRSRYPVDRLDVGFEKFNVK